MTTTGRDTDAFRKAPSHQKVTLPMREIAEQLRNGTTIEDIAATYGRTPRGITHRLNFAGYTSTGEPQPATPTPSPRKDVLFQVREHESLNWMNQAACTGYHVAMWFPGSGATSDAARAICGDCPARAACLDYAIRNNEHGIWGGLNDTERARIKKASA